MDQPEQPSKSFFRAHHALKIGLIVFGILVVATVLAVSASRAPKMDPKGASSPSPSATPTPNTGISTGKIPDIPFKLPKGYVVHVFADGFKAARDLQFSPGGTLLVSDPAAATVTALRDTNRDGVADSAKQIITGGSNVHGLAFYGGKLFVAKTDRVERYAWDEARLSATLDKTLFSLPASNSHNRRTIAFNNEGRMFISVGSTCNVCVEDDNRFATILESDAEGTAPRIYAKGLRNAPFMALNPTSGEIWATEMGRDNLGDNIPPDEINIVRAGQDYGWPKCYGAKVHDTSYDRSSSDPCGSTVAPIFAIPAHNAPLGLAFIKSNQFPLSQQSDLLVAYHGSWNRSTPDGYKIVRLSVRGNTITTSEDFMTGFINDRTVSGRPVDVTFDDRGNLYVSDDKAGAVYIVQKQS